MNKKSLFLTLSMFLILVASNLFTGCSNSSSEKTDVTVPISSDNTNHIAVNSSERVTVVPDIAEVIYSVRSQSADAVSCQQQNTENVTKVLELLKTLGIKDTSIQTSNYTMSPVYDYSNNTEKLKGYQATTTLTVSDLPLDNLGDFLSKSVSSGINIVESVTYESSKYDTAYQEALKLAVISAYSKAVTLAEAGKCSIGNVISIQENSNYSEARYTDNSLQNRKETSAAAAENFASMDIMPGEIEVKVDITVMYQIKGEDRSKQGTN